MPDGPTPNPGSAMAMLKRKSVPEPAVEVPPHKAERSETRQNSETITGFLGTPSQNQRRVGQVMTAKALILWRTGEGGTWHLRIGRAS